MRLKETCDSILPVIFPQLSRCCSVLNFHSHFYDCGVLTLPCELLRTQLRYQEQSPKMAHEAGWYRQRAGRALCQTDGILADTYFRAIRSCDGFEYIPDYRGYYGRHLRSDPNGDQNNRYFRLRYGRLSSMASLSSLRAEFCSSAVFWAWLSLLNVSSIRNMALVCSDMIDHSSFTERNCLARPWTDIGNKIQWSTN